MDSSSAVWSNGFAELIATLSCKDRFRQTRFVQRVLKGRSPHSRCRLMHWRFCCMVRVASVFTCRIGSSACVFCFWVPDTIAFMPISANVVLGQDVKIFQPDLVNLYGCTVGDETKIGAFVEVQKNACIGRRCKISSHTFICEGVTIEDDVFVGHGVMFINDLYPRATVDGRCNRKTIGKSYLHASSGEHRLVAARSFWRSHDRRRRVHRCRSRGHARHPRSPDCKRHSCASGTACSRAAQESERTAG